MKDKNCYLDTTLYEVAYWYMKKKKMDMTTGNLFWIMEKICKRIDRINKNTPDKIIKFTNGYCKLKISL
ncbi:hypothetical protein FJZ33_00030 [Candidatus Poribacteria bacterium]|nr:hypothetical protein [Candidatus Poribacteria bacterium]